MKLLVIDWTNLLFRWYYASAKLNMNNWTRMTWAIYLSLNILSNVKNLIWFEEWKDKIIFTFDNKSSKQNRKSIFKYYKSNRDHSKNLWIFEQIDDFKELVRFSEHKLFDEEWLEADDICWIIVKKFEDNEDIEHIFIYSSDKDFMQFLSEKTTLIRPSNWWILDYYDYLQFFDDYWLTKEQFIEYKALLWDWTDNVFWISKLWSKWIQTILRDFWTVEKWFNDKEWYLYLPKWVREKVKEQKKKNWEQTLIDWLEIEKENWEKEIIKETIKNIFNINKKLVSINYWLDWISNEWKKAFLTKLEKVLEDKKRQNDKIISKLKELKIKTNTI